MEVRNTKKRNFSEVEIETITREVERNKVILFGSLRSGIKGSQKNHIWKEITASVNSVGVDNRTPAEVKKKWSDLKIATKKRVSAFKRSSMQTGGGQPDPSLTLTPTEERVASLIGSASISGICGGGDTDEPEPTPETDNAESPPGTSGLQPSAAQTGPESTGGHAASVSRAGQQARSVLTEEVLERQVEICRSMTEINRSLLAINETLKEINENLKLK